MKYFKKALAMLLSLAMVMGTLTVTTLADQGKEYIGDEGPQVEVTYLDANGDAVGNTIQTRWDGITDAWYTSNSSYSGKFASLLVKPLEDFTGANEITSTMEIPTSAVVTFDINGKQIEGDTMLFSLQAGTSTTVGAELTIIDSAADSTGYLQSDCDSQGVIANVQAYAVLSMESGTIKNCISSNASYGGAIRVRENGTFNMSGGSIIDCQNTFAHGAYISNYGTVNISDDALLKRTNTETNIGDVFENGIYNYGTLNMTGGRLIGFAGSQRTAAIYSTGSGATTVLTKAVAEEGESLTYDEAYIAGNVYMMNSASLKLGAGYFDRVNANSYNDVATTYESCIATDLPDAANEGNTNMQFETESVSVSESGKNFILHVKESTKLAQLEENGYTYYTLDAALEAADGKTVKLLTDHTDAITIDKSDVNAVLDADTYTTGAITVTAGTLGISGGTYAVNITGASSESPIIITGGYFDNSAYTITNADYRGGYYKEEVTPNSRYACQENTDTATKDAYPYVVVFTDFVAQNTTTEDKFGSLKDALDEASEGETIKLLQNDTDQDNGGITFNRNIYVVIDLAGYTLTTRFYVNNDDADIKITDSSEGKTGVLNSTRTSNNGGVFYIQAGKVEAEAGTIQGPTLDAGKSGGIAYVTANTEFVLSGATLTGATAAKGGAVYNMGTFTMTGGTITNCISTETECDTRYPNLIYDSGAIYQYSQSFAPVTTISGGTITGTLTNDSEKTAPAYSGTTGIVIKKGTLTFDSNNVSVSNNTVLAAGVSTTDIARVYVNGAKLKTVIFNILADTSAKVYFNGGIFDDFTYKLFSSNGTKLEYSNPTDNDHRIGTPDPTEDRYHYIANTDTNTKEEYPYTVEQMTQLAYYDVDALRYKIYDFNYDLTQISDDTETEITFIADVTGDITVPAGKTVTFNLGGHTITGDITNNGALTISGSGTVAGNITNATAAATLDFDGTTDAYPTVTGNVIRSEGAGAITINGGTYQGTVSASNIYGGTFNGAVTSVNITNGIFNNNVTVTNDILGGYFDNENYPFSDASDIGFKGGYYTSNNVTPVEGYALDKNTDATTGTTYGYMIVAGNSYVAKNTTTGLYYMSVLDGLNAASSGDTVQMTRDSSAASGISFTKATSVTLDLAGHTFTSRIYVSNAKASLTIADSVGSGALTSTRTDAGGGAIYVNKGSVTATGGTISAQPLATKKDENNKGGLVYINEGATFNLAGATLTGGNAKLGGAVYNAGTFNMTDGIITNCTANTLCNTFSRIIDEVTYTYNYYSGAVYQATTGNTTVTGGSIGNIGAGMPASGNSSDIGNGIYIEGGSFILNGTGHLEGNTVVISDTADENTVLHIEGGTIKSAHINMATGTSGYIYATGGLIDTNTYNFQTARGVEYTNPIDTDHRVGSPDETLQRYHFIENTDEETKDEYGYTMEQMEVLCLVEEEEEEDHVFYHMSEAIAYINDGVKYQGTIKLQSDVEEDFEIPSGIAVTIDFAGNSITGDITNNGTLNLSGSDVITGDVANNGTLTVDGITITGTLTMNNASNTTILNGYFGDIAQAADSTITKSITGGFFKTNAVESFIDTENYKLYDYGGTTTYRYRVVTSHSLCTVTGATDDNVNVSYASVQAAVEALVDSKESGTGAVITLDQEVFTAETIEIPSGLTVTIDYNNNNASIDDTSENPIFVVNKGGTLNLIDTSTTHYALIKGDIDVEDGGTLNIGKTNADGTTIHGGHYANDISAVDATDVNVISASFKNQQEEGLIDPNSIVVTGFEVDPQHGCQYIVKSKYIVNIDTLQAALEDGGRYVVSTSFAGTMPSTKATTISGSISPSTGEFELGTTVIDLNGKTITFKASRNPQIEVPSGASLTITDSTRTSSTITGGKLVAHTPEKTNSNPNILIKVDEGGTFTLNQAELDGGKDNRTSDTLDKNGTTPGTALYTEGTVNIKQFSTIVGAATTDTCGGSAIYVAGGTTTIARASISTTDTAKEGVIKVVGGELITTSSKNSSGYPVGPEISGFLYTDAPNDNSGEGTITLNAGYFTYNVDESQSDFMGDDCSCYSNSDTLSTLPYKVTAAFVAMNLDTGLTYSTLQAAIDSAANGETIIITENITTSGNTIAAGQNIIIDMNGMKVLGDGKAPIITNNGTLQIIDSTTDDGTNAVFTTYDSSARTQYEYSQNGSAINNASGATLTIGGTFTRDEVTYTSETIYFNKCAVNTDSAAKTKGGAIYNAGTVNATNVIFDTCQAYQGGAIYNYEGGKVSLTSSIIKGCTTAGENGTAIYNRGGDVTLSATTVVGTGTASVIHNYGSAGKTATMKIPAGDKQTFVFGKVGWGTASTGAVKSYVAGGYFSDINGDELGKQQDSLQTGYNWKQLETAVTDAYENSYTYQPEVKYVAKVTYSNKSTVNYNSTLQNAIEQADNTENNDSITYIEVLCDITEEEWKSATGAPYGDSGNTYQYLVSESRNVVIDLAGYTITEPTHIYTNEDSTKTNYKYTMFQVLGDLEITDSVGGGAITQGEYKESDNITYNEKGGGVYVATTGTFVLSGSATIKNCYTYGTHTSESDEDATASYGGGAIFNRNKVTLKGNAVIEGCQALNNKGGGVYNDAGSSMIMTDNVTISNCISYGNGGGIHTYAAADDTARADMTSVYIYGGTIEKCWAGHVTIDTVSDTKTVTGNGGAICVSSNCIAYMFGGTLTYNRAYQYGGAVYISYNTERDIAGTFNMYGIYGGTPTIEHNQCASTGGGVYLANNAHMGVWGSIKVSENHALTRTYVVTRFQKDTSYNYIDTNADNNLFIMNDTVKVDGPLVTGSETALDTYNCAAADTTTESIPGTSWTYSSSTANKGYEAVEAYPGTFKTYADYVNLTKTEIRVSVPTLEENPIFAKTFSEEATWLLPNGTTQTVQTPGSCFDNFNTYTAGANVGESGTPIIDSDEARFDVVSSREIWDENEVPQTGSITSDKKSDDYNNIIYLFLAEIDSASVTLANQLAINYQCSITENKYNAQLASAGEADVMLLEVTIADANGNVLDTQIIEGKDGGTFEKYDELTCETTDQTTKWHKWIFTFDGIDPCWMAEDITTNMYLGYLSNTKKEYVKTSKRLVDDNVYSVAEYCNDVYDAITNGSLKPYSDHTGNYEDMKNLLADILMYGETAQLFQDYDTDYLCTKVDWAYTYDGRGEITSRTLITKKINSEITIYNEKNSYWDVSGSDALNGAKNRIFDDKGLENPAEDVAKADQASARWSWIDEYRTNTETEAEKQIPSSEDKFVLEGKTTNTTDLIDPDTSNYTIVGATCMFGKGGYIMPRFFFDIKGENLSNYRVKVILHKDDDKRTEVDNSAKVYYFDGSMSNGYYYVDFGLSGDTTYQLYPQQFGYILEVGIQVKKTNGGWRWMQVCWYGINNYLYDWVHADVERPETMSETQYQYMQDLAYATYRYGQSTKKLYNDLYPTES